MNTFQICKTSDSITVNSGLLKLRFGIEKKSVTFDELSHASGRNWLSEFGDVDLLWKINFIGPHGTSPVYSNNEADFQKAFISKDESDVKEITLVWTVRATHDVHPEINIRIRFDKGKSLSYWNLQISSLPEGWKVKRADFPYISNMAVLPNTKVVVPTGWGNEYDFKPCFKYEGPYPSWLTGMQMVAFYDNERSNGLYFSSHDPEANLKEFHIHAGEKSAGLLQVHIPTLPGDKAESFALNYEVVLGVFDGGYYEAGQIYREFALKTPWADQSKRRKPPEWLEKTELWLRPDGSAEKNLEITKKALEFFDVATALHWYRWHEIPYDTHYPEYLPALPGLAEAISELHDLGTHVALYINGRLWDPESKSWHSEKAFEYAARSENGECYSEIYGSKIPNNVMCPCTEFWQDKVSGIARSLEKELGVHGVYIDQIAAGKGVPCYRSDHGHAPGGGDNWRIGYEKLLGKTRDNISENTMLLTEENSECWLNLFDAHLMVNTQVDGKVVPLFQSVYSGKTILVCSLYYSPDEPLNSLTFRMKNSMAFLWGSQPGWIQPDRIMAPGVRAEAEFLKNIARTRRFAHDFIDSGRFLGMIPVKGDNPLLSGIMKGPFSGEYDLRLPAVSASAWISEINRVGILVTNISDSIHEVKIEIPLDKTGLPGNVDYKTGVYNSEGLVKTENFREPCVSFQIPERSAMVLSVSH